MLSKLTPVESRRDLASTSNNSFFFTFSATRSISGVCYNILVKSTQESTIYDISLTNSSGIVVYSRTSETGTLSEITSLILKGIYTISISNATSDELFTIQLIIREN